MEKTKNLLNNQKYIYWKSFKNVCIIWTNFYKNNFCKENFYKNNFYFIIERLISSFISYILISFFILMLIGLFTFSMWIKLSDNDFKNIFVCIFLVTLFISIMFYYKKVSFLYITSYLFKSLKINYISKDFNKYLVLLYKPLFFNKNIFKIDNSVLEIIKKNDLKKTYKSNTKILKNKKDF